MTIRRITGALLLAGLVAYVGWDIYAEVAGQHATISEVTLGYFYRHPLLALIFGAIVGHLTWPRQVVAPSSWAHVALLISLAVVLLVLDRIHGVPSMMPIIPVLVGLPMGHLLWPQGQDVEGIG